MGKAKMMLCKLKKNEDISFDEIKELVKAPQYICKKCYRACNNAEFLCKSSEL